MLKTIFGTDGIRCQMNSSYLTETNLIKLGQAIAQWAPINSHFIFGSDTRASCNTIKQIFSRELYNYNHKISDAGDLPTPMLCELVENNASYDFGIMITASHNPAKDNGIKIITPIQKLTASDELEISALFWGETKSLASSHEKKSAENLDPYETLRAYTSEIKKNLTRTKFDQFKIVIDCAHGATSFFAPQVFESFGFAVTTINNQPDGLNINKNSGALHPEQLIKKVVQKNADFGCAFDGDGDRLVIVTPEGRILNGDDLLTVFAKHPNYQSEKIFAGTIMSNQAVENYFAKEGKQFIRTDVGDKNLVKELATQNALLGTEPSGHLIMRDHSFCSDGIYSALLFFDTILNNPGMQIPLFTPYPSVKKNIIVEEKKDLQEEKILKITKLYEKQLSPGRLIIRYSGTEPLLRIAIEHNDKEFAQKNLDSLVDELTPYL